MNWQEKIAVTQELLDTVDSLDIHFRLTDGATNSFLESMRQRFPFVDDEYLSFLKLSNGARLDLCVLFGSGEDPDPSFPSVIADLESMRDDLEYTEWQQIAADDGVIPIGRDSGCSRFLMMPNKEIILVDVIRQTPAVGRVIAQSFAELLEDVFMGEHFDDLFYPNKLTLEDEDAWTQHLRQQGWRP